MSYNTISVRLDGTPGRDSTHDALQIRKRLSALRQAIGAACDRKQAIKLCYQHGASSKTQSVIVRSFARDIIRTDCDREIPLSQVLSLM